MFRPQKPILRRMIYLGTAPDVGRPASEDPQEDHETVVKIEEYEPRCYWFIVFDCFRRMLLTGMIILILPDTPTQIGCGMMICLISIKVGSKFDPFIPQSKQMKPQI